MLAFGQTSNTSTEFVPLTNIPALTDLGTGFTLEAFLNGLFRIAIGAAAVIAVLQIMRAGIMYMASDSGFAEKKEAKNLIGLAIGGLVLVLSPVIVFSIINPKILSLKIGGIEKLRSTLSEEGRGNTLFVEPAETADARTTVKARCEGIGGTVTFTCTPKTGGTGRVVPVGEQCNGETESSSAVCRKNENTPAPGDCTAYGTPTASIGQVCTGAGLTQIERSCCSGLSDSAVCCGRRITTEEMYSWKAEYYKIGSCAIGLTRGESCNDTEVLKGGPHDTKDRCMRDMETTVPDGYAVKGTPQCVCGFNIGSQPTGACPPN